MNNTLIINHVCRYLTDENEYWLKSDKIQFWHVQSEQQENEPQESDIYEHIKDSSSHHDAQTLDTATEEQQQKACPAQDMEEKEVAMEEDNVDEEVRICW